MMFMLPLHQHYKIMQTLDEIGPIEIKITILYLKKYWIFAWNGLFAAIFIMQIKASVFQKFCFEIGFAKII